VAELGGMSKTPIRAALQRLEADGLVLISPQQGILVREISIREIVEIFDLRLALEAFVAERLAGRLAPLQRAALDANLASAAACVQAGDEVGYARLDAAFHLLLCELHDNREIAAVLRRNADRLARVIIRVMRRDPARLAASHADHQAIVEALAAGDPQLAAQRVREHLQYGRLALIS
jgi:DNA-binding GntR family transcriptional regulator